MSGVLFSLEKENRQLREENDRLKLLVAQLRAELTPERILEVLSQTDPLMDPEIAEAAR